MSRYLIVQAHDPFDADAHPPFFALALSLASAGHDVAVLFAGGGVTAARAGGHSFWLAELRLAGVDVVVESTALRAHGMVPADVAPGITVAPSGAPADAFAGRKPLWIADRRQRQAA